MRHIDWTGWFIPILIPAVILTGVFGICYSSQIVEEIVIQGTVKDISYSAAGWGHSDLTVIYLTDGRTVVIERIVEPITIGKTYEFIFGKERTGDIRFLRFIEIQ